MKTLVANYVSANTYRGREREPLMLNNGDQVLYIDGLTITDATGVQVTNVGINWTVTS